MAAVAEGGDGDHGAAGGLTGAQGEEGGVVGEAPMMRQDSAQQAVQADSISRGEDRASKSASR